MASERSFLTAEGSSSFSSSVLPKDDQEGKNVDPTQLPVENIMTSSPQPVNNVRPKVTQVKFPVSLSNLSTVEPEIVPPHEDPEPSSKSDFKPTDDNQAKIIMEEVASNFREPLNTTVRSRSDEVVTEYDTTNELSYTRSMANSTGKNVMINDTSDTKTAGYALKFIDKMNKKTSNSQDVIIPTEVAASSILDDAAFTQKWEEEIKSYISNDRPDTSGQSVGNDEISSTARMIGRIWRAVFRHIIVSFIDPINAYRLSRPLQLHIDYVNPLEAYLLGDVIEALDAVAMKSDRAEKKLNKAVVEALKNRNVARALVQSSSSFNIRWHAYTQILYTRIFMFASQFSLASFPPPSENFLSAKGHALSSILRQVLGPGRWFTRLVTGGREEFVVDDDNAIVQNLAAETNGFEAAMRQQYGNYFGRQKINQFRSDNRLSTDESVVRTFTTQPGSTLSNNGVVHVLRVVANHWESILSNPYGVFGHQRMEMLDVRVMLRFHMPVVLLTLANLRGLNSWDSKILGPLVKDLMNLGTSTDMDDALELIEKLKEVVENVCGGVPARSDPFKRWLKQMMIASELIMEQKVKIKKIISSVSAGIEAGYNLAKKNDWKTPSDNEMVTSILIHIKFDIAKSAYHKPKNWLDAKKRKEEQSPEEKRNEEQSLKEKRIEEIGKMTWNDMETIIEFVAKNGALKAEVKQFKDEVKIQLGLLGGFCKPLCNILLDNKGMNVDTRKKLTEIHKKLLEATLSYIEKDLEERKSNGMSDDMCKRALEFVTPRDKRTLIELVRNGQENSRPARLLLGRTKTLLRREIKRAKLDEQIENLRKKTNIPFSESIVRAQKAFMTIELDCIRIFSYSAFMEFEDLRTDMRKLQVISQMQCRALDEARMNRLVAIRDSYPILVGNNEMIAGKQYFVEERPYKYELRTFDEQKKSKGKFEGKVYKVPPQNMLVVGGGPSGLLTTLHCLENCLKTGGRMKLYEARDAFEKAGGTYERAQVVRLDSRWVRMLRYHLGTSFEDVWVPAWGETDAHLGNTLPDQGFIEITIKDLENVLHLEISKLWSLNLIELSSKSSAEFDYKKNVMTKRGKALKEHDLVKRLFDKNGRESKKYHSWEVVEIQLHERLSPKDVRPEEHYYVYDREYSLRGLKKFQLVGKDIEDSSNPLYKFFNKEQGITIQVHADRFPAIYPEDQHGFKTIVLQCIESNDQGVYERQLIEFKTAENKRFVMDVGQTNIVFATGKPTELNNHTKITPEEPYGVCCIQGLKISLNMHNFGEKRWGDGVIDDIRSQTEQNTRVVGDFTKSVNVVPIVKEMINILANEHDYRKDDYMEKFDQVKENIGREVLASLNNKVDAKKWRRQRLQVRFFETGDNFYLGMEFNREYDLWKNTQMKQELDLDDSMAKAIAPLIDRLWYEAAFEVMRGGDVYNPSGSEFIPKVYLIDSTKSTKLRSMVVGDSFRIKSNNTEKYEVLIPGTEKVWVRSVEGIIVELKGDEDVLRVSDLTRSPDGNTESKVAIATFPVGHVVSHRAVNVQRSSYWCTFEVGDRQASPHFMRYSGLTAAAISSMLINDYVAAGLDRTKVYSSKERILALSRETNWSNEEVVKRGTGSNYGVDGFLRPGLEYNKLVEYLYYKVEEMSVAGYMDEGMIKNEEKPIDAMFQIAWLKKFASALIPRGMELENSYTRALERCLSQAILERLMIEMKDDEDLTNETFIGSFQNYLETDEKREMEQASGNLMFQIETEWGGIFEQLFKSDNTSEHVQKIVRDKYLSHACTMAEVLEKSHGVALDDYLNSKRISSEAENEPKSTDALVADFAVEAQAFANGLATSAMLATMSLVLISGQSTMGGKGAKFFGVITALFNIPVAFGTMTNVSRYQNRNEEFRTEYYNKKLSGLKRALFKVLTTDARRKVKAETNPFLKQLEDTFKEFEFSAKYYNAEHDDIQNLYNEMKTDNKDSIKKFMLEIRTHFIPDVYQKEVYLKDNLWQVHLACSQIVDYLKMIENERGNCDGDIVSTINELETFSTRLEESLQTGPILWGFIRQGKSFSKSVFAAPFRYWTYLICGILWTKTDKVRWYYPLSVVIRDIEKKMDEYNRYIGNEVLKKEIRDLEELYHATLESALASCIYFVACGSFSFAILLTAINAFNATVEDEDLDPGAMTSIQGFIRAGASLISIFAAIYALTYLVKLLFHQTKVRKNIKDLPSRINASISEVTYIATLQSLISFIRICAAIGSMVSLCSSFLFGFDDSASPISPRQIWLGACVSLGGWLLAIILSFYVEFFPLWNLGPKASSHVCTHFKTDLIKIYDRYKESMDTTTEERIIREYTAREFLDQTRFDSVLKADRFTTIMQIILSDDFDMTTRKNRDLPRDDNV